MMGDAGEPGPVPVQEAPQDPEELAAREERRRWRVQEYIKLLKSDRLTYRWKAAEALGAEPDPDAVEPLIAALKDQYVDVSWLAAKSLGMIGDPRAVGPLIEALRSDEKWLRIGAAWGLGRLRDARAVEPLIPASLRSKERRQEDCRSCTGRDWRGHGRTSADGSP